MAMRGHASIQGSTDVPTLYELLPGYIAQPASLRDHGDLQSYLKHEEVKTGYWANLPNFVISLLKAWYGDAATKDNDYGFTWVPRLDGNYSQLATFVSMAEGKIKGLYLFGQNPAAGAPNGRLNREALKKLKWLVVRDWFEIDPEWQTLRDRSDYRQLAERLRVMPPVAIDLNRLPAADFSTSTAGIAPRW